MSDTIPREPSALWSVVLWIARLTGTAAIIPLMMIVFGEYGAGPAGARGWTYLALFPFGFSAGYLLAWRRPMMGGYLSLTCMLASLILIHRIFDWRPYLIWAILCLPGVLFLVAGWRLRSV
jgi:hypothetical protein